MDSKDFDFASFDRRWILSCTRAALWICPDIARDTCFFSSELALMLGYSPEELPDSIEKFIELIHPDDRERTKKSCTVENFHTSVEFRVVARDGSIKWLRLAGMEPIAAQSSAGQSTETADEDSTTLAAMAKKGLRGVLMDITDAKAIETRAIEESRHKSAFLGRMSHDMRTPLHAIIGLGDVIRTAQSDPAQRALVERVIEAGESLLGLVNDLLDIEQIKSGNLKLDIKATDLRRAIWDCVALHQQTQRYSRVAIRYHIDPRVPRLVLTDARRLLQVLNNLVENALKFTLEGSVSISCVVQAKREQTFDIRFQVSDTGSGITADEIEKIFNPFYRGRVEEEAPRGQGLGLSIVKDIVDQLGGAIQVESDLGQGSNFFFTIPLIECARHFDETAHLSRTPATQLQQQDRVAARSPSSAFNRIERAGAEARDTSLGAAWSLNSAGWPSLSETPCILVADDSPINRQIISAYLQNEGVRVLFAENGQEAFECYSKMRPDLVIMDLRMPIMSGADATRAIRFFEAENAIAPRPILAVSASALKEDVADALQAGCNEHFSKPIRRAELVAALNKHLPQRDSHAVSPGVASATTTASTIEPTQKKSDEVSG
jgi:signal transduction histidine kinase/DNA-binding NarL/FixJ family response regulator